MACWFHHPWKWRHKHRRRRHLRVALVVGAFAVELIPGEVVHMATELKVGKTIPFSIEYFDQDGKEMVERPFLDTTPLWANTTPATQALTAGGDGMTASGMGVAAGTDTVRVVISVAGVQFTATLDVTVIAVPPPKQVLTSIAIVAGTPL